ncbi:MAG: sel1 repeat family protein [Alphaproteobacteria bacterium]|nr:sel1 repeat family protein [Alphaproteobacteria bacterium]
MWRYAILVLLLAALPARADFGEGLAAYDAGDYAAARTAWLPLAEQGDSAAQTALAGLYAQGAGVPRDYAAAARWFRRAADQGDMVGQLNLGDYYASGLGVPRDLETAWLWLSLAARQDSVWATNRRDAVAREMSAAAIAAATRRLERWRPKKP